MGTQSLHREFGEEKICVSESYVVDMEHLSNLVEKDINANSRITVSSSSSSQCFFVFSYSEHYALLLPYYFFSTRCSIVEIRI